MFNIRKRANGIAISAAIFVTAGAAVGMSRAPTHHWVTVHEPAQPRLATVNEANFQRYAPPWPQSEADHTGTGTFSNQYQGEFIKKHNTGTNAWAQLFLSPTGPCGGTGNTP